MINSHIHVHNQVMLAGHYIYWATLLLPLLWCKTRAAVHHGRTVKWASVGTVLNPTYTLTCIPCSFEITRLSIKSTLFPTSTTLTDSNAFCRTASTHKNSPVTMHTLKALQSRDIIAPSQTQPTHLFDVSNPLADIPEGLLVGNIVHQYNSLQWEKRRSRVHSTILGQDLTNQFVLCE